MTVYNHFPTEAELIGACSAHWMAANPSPDPSLWEEIAEPSERLRVGLQELYAWYRGSEDMMGNVLRDAPIVEPLGDIMDGFWWPYMEQVVRVLAEGWRPAVSARAELAAALRLVVDFSSWRTLSRSGIDDAKAADLAVLMVSAVAVPREQG
jgi:AcrR family transcriptional regulator